MPFLPEISPEEAINLQTNKLIALNVIDAVSTYIATHKKLGYEVNPILAKHLSLALPIKAGAGSVAIYFLGQWLGQMVKDNPMVYLTSVGLLTVMSFIMMRVVVGNIKIIWKARKK